MSDSDPFFASSFGKAVSSLRRPHFFFGAFRTVFCSIKRFFLKKKGVVQRTEGTLGGDGERWEREVREVHLEHFRVS